MVTADETVIQSVDRLLVDVLRWHWLTVDVGEALSLQDVVRKVGQAFESLVANTPDNIYLSVRVTVKGKTPAHGELFGLESQLREEVLAQAAGLGMNRLWVEKVRLETEPVAGSALIADRSDAIADLQHLLADAPLDADFLESLLADLRPMIDKSPIELIRAVPELDAIRSGNVTDIVTAVTPGLLAYLSTSN